MTSRTKWLNATIKEGLRAGVAYSDIERELAIEGHTKAGHVGRAPARTIRSKGWRRSKQAWERRPEPTP